VNYKIFIDETGNFAKKTRAQRHTDFIAGWVCREKFTFVLKNLLVQTAEPFNREIRENDGDDFILKIPDHLHFIPLHLPEKRIKKDQHIKVPEAKVRDMISAIFAAIEKDVLLVFRSYGFPRYYANEQAAYLEILRAAVLQLLDDLPLQRDDRVHIVIAARRIKSLMGEYGYTNIRQYETYLCESLKKEISESFRSKNMGLPHITVEDARESAELAAADLFCGALRWADYDYLHAYKNSGKVREYSIHSAFIHIPNRSVPRIAYIFENDPVMGLIQGFLHLAQNPGNAEMENALRSMCAKLTDEDKKDFAKELEYMLHEKVTADPYRYRNLDAFLHLADEIDRFFTEKHIRAVTWKYRIRIMSHKGGTDIETVRGYLNLLDKDGAEIWGSMYHAAQERLETLLFIVQPAAFNVFRFDAVEAYLSEEIRKYETLFPDKRQTDETRAKLEGTIGQMYGFLCDFPDGEAFFEDALLYLQKDLAHCRKHSHTWFQAAGYLTSLYFKKGDYANALQSFLQETRSENRTEEEVFDLSKQDLFCSKQGDFFLLHRLYLCALGLKNGKTLIGEDYLAEKLLTGENRNQYPVFLSVKWLGVIYALKGNWERAWDLFTSVDTSRTENFTLDVLRLPIRILAHLSARKLGKKSDLDLEKDLRELEKRMPGIRSTLKKLGLENYRNYNDAWDVYEIARIMPFYYS